MRRKRPTPKASQRLRAACADFLCQRDVPIRGRSRPETVYALAL
jgi:hypothetical protein